MNDAGEIFQRYASDVEVTRLLGWPRHRSLADTETFLRFAARQWEQWPGGPYLIVSRLDGQVIGGTGFGFETTEEAMTGYVLARDAWGKGFATEALTAMADLAPRIGVTRLFALCHPEHGPSRRVLEKCGFLRDGGPNPEVVFPNLSPGVRQEALSYSLEFTARTERGR